MIGEGRVGRNELRAAYTGEARTTHLLSRAFQSARRHERDRDRRVRASVSALQKSHGNANGGSAAHGHCGVRLLNVSLYPRCFRISADAYSLCCDIYTEVNG